MSQIQELVYSEARTPSGGHQLDALYQALHHSVRARCRRILRDPVAADDATQETFLRVQLHLDAVSSMEDVRFWIHRVAVNYCLNQLRNRALREKACPEPAAELTSDLESLLLARDEARHLMGRLPDHLRSVAWLREVEGLDQRDMAEALGVSRRTVVSRVAELRRFAERALQHRSER